jgi:hypothetical protein
MISAARLPPQVAYRPTNPRLPPRPHFQPQQPSLVIPPVMRLVSAPRTTPDARPSPSRPPLQKLHSNSPADSSIQASLAGPMAKKPVSENKPLPPLQSSSSSPSNSVASSVPAPVPAPIPAPAPLQHALEGNSTTKETQAKAEPQKSDNPAAPPQTPAPKPVSQQNPTNFTPRPAPAARPSPFVMPFQGRGRGRGLVASSQPSPPPPLRPSPLVVKTRFSIRIVNPSPLLRPPTAALVGSASTRPPLLLPRPIVARPILRSQPSHLYRPFPQRILPRPPLQRPLPSRTINQISAASSASFTKNVHGNKLVAKGFCLSLSLSLSFFSFLFSPLASI